MLLFLAFAPPGGAPQQGGGGMLALLPMLAIFLIFYLLILRPQAKRQRKHQQMIEQLNRGDKIVITGGVHGEIVRVNEKEGTFVLKIGKDVEVVVDRGAVARKLGAPE